MTEFPIWEAASYISYFPSFDAIKGSADWLPLPDVDLFVDDIWFSDDPLLDLASDSYSCALRVLGAGVTRSFGTGAFGRFFLFKMEADLRSVASSIVVGLNRTIRGLPDLESGGEPDLCLNSGLIVGGLCCADRLCFSNASSAPFRDTGDPSITDASPSSIAFASALSFIGGTGNSSSELSAVENFQAGGSGSSLTRGTAERGEPLLRYGLIGRNRALFRGKDL